MSIVYSVIDDLYTFVVRISCAIVLRVQQSFVQQEEAKEEVVSAEPLPTGKLEPAATFDESLQVEFPTFTRVSEVLKRVGADPLPLPDALPEAFPEAIADAVVREQTVMYVAAAGAPLFIQPAREFDSVLELLPFGELVMALESRGRWIKISFKQHEGWVLREALAPQAASVYPTFVAGEEYHADDQSVVKLRGIIHDEFGAGAAEMPLQAGEYVVYRLFRKNLAITWPSARPRTPGNWHTILRGCLGVHIGIAPKTGAIMEFIREDETGHVAYIESVLPDNTITISEVNMPDNGIYNERTLTETEWKDLAPVFIQIS